MEHLDEARGDAVPPLSTAESGERERLSENSLAGIRLIEGLRPADLAAVERACRFKRYDPQEQIFDRGSRSSDVFFLVEGKVRIVNYSLSGREITFDELAPGACFGEIAALDGRPRSTSVMAVELSLVAALPRSVFLDVLAHHPAIALKVMLRLAQIIRDADDRIMDLSTLAAQNRVQAEILRQARGDLTDRDTARIHPIPLHADIASRVSTTRETVARTMNDLARKGIVKRTKDSLVVRSLSRLASLVEEVRG